MSTRWWAQILLLMGEDLTHYRIWDGMRAIDYLLTRPEVDPKRIACAGHSGGGTLTLFISALDERVQCAIVNEGGTGHRWPLEIRPEAPWDRPTSSKIFSRRAIYGIDQCDLHVAIAPRPLLAMIENYSPRFDKSRRAYPFAIRADGSRRTIRDRGSNRSACLDSEAPISRYGLAFPLVLRKAGTDREPDFELEKPETLYCTPNGSIRYSQQGDTIYCAHCQETGESSAGTRQHR